MPLPRPSGSHGVGSVTHEIVDASRTGHLASETPGRRLLLEVWYPAVSSAAETEPIWAELRGDPRTPLPMRIVLGCLRARTATVKHAPMALLASAAPLVIYNHGLISFAAENTSLMEELASHGYAVIAIQHAEQLLELRSLNRSQSATERSRRDALERQLKAASAQERSALGPRYYDGAENTGRIAIERAADTSFVLTHAHEVLAAIPGWTMRSVDTSAAHLVGFSLGGAVATVTAEHDPRTRSVANLDGGMYGSRNAREIRVPYLMMYSAVSDGINDALLPAQARRDTRPGTAHLNYHDIAALLPFLRYLRATGSANAAAFVAQRNAAVLEFLGGRSPFELDVR